MKPVTRKNQEEVAFGRFLEAVALSEAERYRLRVLVWGSTPRASGEQAKFASKRRQIKEALNLEGHHAYFSEDLAPSDSPLPANLLEIVQAENVDVVIDLATGYGAIGEAHEFGMELGKKLLLWLPFAARKKFVDEGTRRLIEAAGGRSVFFGEAHLRACALTRASVDFVNDKRYLQARIEKQIERLRQAAPIKRDSH
jgi:hypothetical protein